MFVRISTNFTNFFHFLSTHNTIVPAVIFCQRMITGLDFLQTTLAPFIYFQTIFFFVTRISFLFPISLIFQLKSFNYFWKYPLFAVILFIIFEGNIYELAFYLFNKLKYFLASYLLIKWQTFLYFSYCLKSFLYSWRTALS